MDERQVALPKLYGAPAYSPPRRPVESPKPFDPDELPITAQLSDEERDFVESLPPRAFAPGGGVVLGADDASTETSETDEARGRRAGGLGRFLRRG